MFGKIHVNRIQPKFEILHNDYGYIQHVWMLKESGYIIVDVQFFSFFVCNKYVCHAMSTRE